MAFERPDGNGNTSPRKDSSDNVLSANRSLTHDAIIMTVGYFAGVLRLG